MSFDSTGKISFDHIYTQPDPRDYFTTLREVDYCIPQLAKPYFAKLVDEYRQARNVENPTVLDIGCSYGVNAALAKCDATMDELYEHYCSPDAETADRDALLARDRRLVRARGGHDGTRFIGFDSSQPALAYAHSAGFLDDTIRADLEENEPTDRQGEQLAEADLVVSTGCLGYVTERTISRVAVAATENRPWMAHFVLRMFSYEPIAETLTGLGYQTASIDGVFKQRRFASAEEQSLVLDTLSTADIDPEGLEADGWLYASLYLSQPMSSENGTADLATAMNTLTSESPHQTEQG